MDILVGVKINLKLYKLLWLCGVKQQSVSLYDRMCCMKLDEWVARTLNWERTKLVIVILCR
jgi:hypothetical protein